MDILLAPIRPEDRRFTIHLTDTELAQITLFLGYGLFEKYSENGPHSDAYLLSKRLWKNLKAAREEL